LWACIPTVLLRFQLFDPCLQPKHQLPQLLHFRIAVFGRWNCGLGKSFHLGHAAAQSYQRDYDLSSFCHKNVNLSMGLAVFAAKADFFPRSLVQI
jgi:hypothetical protein